MKAATIILCLLASLPVSAARLVLFPTVAGCGGGLAPAGDSAINGTLGQPVTSFVRSDEMLHWSGFWAADISAPAFVTSVAALKTATDGSYVSITGAVASSDSGDFSSFFYMQSPVRSSGIRVVPLSDEMPEVARGSRITAIGSVSTLSSGERRLSSPAVTVTSSAGVPVPLTMTNRELGGSSFGTPPTSGQYGPLDAIGLNNVGLLVRTTGLVTTRGKGYFVITDGSPEEVRVLSPLALGAPAAGSRVFVTGISSLRLDAEGVRRRYLMPRDMSDIIVQ